MKRFQDDAGLNKAVKMEGLLYNAELNRAILGTVMDGIVTIKADATIALFNPAAEKIFGYTQDEVIGKNVNILMPEPYSSEHDTYIKNYLTTGIKKIIGIGREVEGRRKDGRVFPLSLEVTEMRVDGERMFTAILRDFTDKKLAQELQEKLVADVAAANKNLGDFAHIVSHELKAPLRGIGSLVEWITKDYHGRLDESGEEMLKLLKSRVTRMHSLIEGILRYSRVSRTSGMEKEVDLNAVVRDVVEMLAPPPDISITVSRNLPVITCDPVRMSEVFENLLSNAVKFMDKPKGRISIGVGSDDNFYTFHINDNGPGIDPRYHERIFDMFFMVTDGAESENTGIGLTLTKRIVETMGGRIWVDSGPGSGSVFYFTIPRKGAGGRRTAA
jgi:two-component system sensor kinase FixL